MKLKNSGRYSTKELTEGLFEPSSQNRVYKNLLGITKKREMDKLEYQELVKASRELFANFDAKHKFKEGDIKKIHRTWLGKIYSWAGEYRQVNLSKGGFPFAAANQIPRLMKFFEKNELKKHTPCNFESLEKIIEAIAVVHVELVLIHPFREGNGRMSRLVANLMALQAGLPPLDFSGIKNKKRQEYFAAVRAGLNRDYKPMIKIFESVIKRTLKKYKLS
jgi:cell filamentation protein